VRQRDAKKYYSYKGHDSDLKNLNISKLDGTLELSAEKKFELICELTLFHYQLKNNTNDIPRFLRTTACIRKA
jgi:hypothetical protein